MPDITAIVLTLNEESKIADCLKSVKWADELIVVDSYSTDRTMEIARDFGARVIQHPFRGYASQRNFALTQASGRWVLFLDADERCTPELGAEIRDVASSPEYDGFYLPRRNQVFGKWFRGGGHQEDKQLRLFRRADYVTYGDCEIHEKPLGLKSVGVLKGFLVHLNYESISQYLDKMNRYTSLEARELLKGGLSVRAGNSLWLLGFKPAVLFLYVYFYKKGYRDGLAGLIYSLLSGYYVFVKYAKCWEGGRRRGLSADAREDRV